jgi:hypothetical protein
MRFTITSVDYAPEELLAQVPIRGRILRQISGPGRPDYHLAELEHPITWNKEKEAKMVSHLVLAARWVGGVLSPQMRTTPVNIAYVTDHSLLADSRLDFKKCDYVAIGVADGE